MILGRTFSAWIDHLLACMGGCLGCYTKPTPIIAVDEPSKGLKIQGRTVKKSSLCEEFWSTSTYEMENSRVQSQRSISSISTSTQTFDHHAGAGSTSNPSEFVNHGLILWNQIRQQWTGNKKPEIQSQKLRESRLRSSSSLSFGTNTCLSSTTISICDGMQRTRVYLGATSHFHNPFLYRKWWIFLWTSGSRRDYMTRPEFTVDNSMLLVKRIWFTLVGLILSA